MHRVYRCLLFVFAVSGWALYPQFSHPSAFAQDIAMADKSDVVETPDVVVSATKTPLSPKQVTSAVEVITGEELEQKKIKTVIDGLRLSSGVFATSSGGPGTEATVKMRGAFARHTLVMIDGVVVATVANGATYMLDTAALNDGWHELRVVARDNSQSLSSGSSAIPITVNNAGLSCSIAPSATGGNLASVFQFTIAGGAAGVIESRVVHNSRVIASIPSGSGVVEVPAQMIGAGEATLFAECELADGSVFRSPPVSLDIAFTGAPTPGQTPIAFNSAKRVTNAHPFVVELPAAFLDALPGANYSVLSSPYQCTTIQAGAGPFAIYEPVQAAHGVDTMTFRVATASGESSVATVRIIYTNCAADMDASGTLDFFDFLTFQNLFSAQVPSADFDRDGQFTFFDFLGFQNSFAGGC